MSIKVQILLSTYNGEKYISEQINSLLKQTYKDLSILVRDDGSKDTTRAFLKEYAAYPQFQVSYGYNIGVVKSFFELLKYSAGDAGFFAFCDQDDVWLPNKIERAIKALEKYSSDEPLMYCSKAEIVDKKLRHTGYSQNNKREASFYNALVQNIAIGATMVFNKAARDLVLKDLPNYTIMHDWWMYLVVTAFGKVIFDSNTSIKYRQHGTNTIGYDINPWNEILKRMKRFKGMREDTIFIKQAKEIYRIFGGNLPREKRKELEKFLAEKGIFERLKYFFSMKVYRQTFWGNVFLRILVLLGKI